MLVVSQQFLNFVFILSVICGTIFFISDLLFCITECILPLYLRIIIIIISFIGTHAFYYYIETQERKYLYRTPLMLPLLLYWFYIFTKIFSL